MEDDVVEYNCPSCGMNEWEVTGDVAVCNICGYVQEGILPDEE